MSHHFSPNRLTKMLTVNRNVNLHILNHFLRLSFKKDMSKQFFPKYIVKGGNYFVLQLIIHELPDFEISDSHGLVFDKTDFCCSLCLLHCVSHKQIIFATTFGHWTVLGFWIFFFF